VALPPELRRNLQELGLRALVKRRFGPELAEDARPVPFSGGAAVVAGSLAAVFADSTAGLGSAIDVATRNGASELCFFSEHNTAATARRASTFRLAVSVIDPEGDFAALDPAPPPPVEPMPAVLEPAAVRMRSAGLETEWEHGVLSGEWLGLEVARAVASSDGVRFEVGVGKHDRAANSELYPEGPSDGFLDQAVATVREWRRPDAPVHPVNQLAPERWLRSVARRHPDLIGLGHLHAGPAPSERPDLRRRAVAPAWADGPDPPVVVVFSVGVDPDLVAQAADARLQAPGWVDHPAASAALLPLVIVVPEGDDHPLSRRLVAELRQPARLQTVPADWRSWAGAAGSEP
jgi:hypothetical protein